jgi:AraC-like DNA-binding protein
MYIYSQRLRIKVSAEKKTAAGAIPTTRLAISSVRSSLGTARRIFNVVLRSGHFRADGGHRIERRGVSEHELLYCLSGSGDVFSGKKRFRIEPFHLAWLSGFGAHWEERGLPWEVLWMRVGGPQVEQAWKLLAVRDRPIFDRLPPEQTKKLFSQVNHLLTEGGSVSDVMLNCHIAELLGYLVESRGAAQSRPREQADNERSRIGSAIDRMSADLKHSWRVGELARLCSMSERHFFRGFKMTVGLSPIDWLRRERIRLAQRKLLNGGHSVKEISDQVGYNDVFFFSRDFKRQTGWSPSEYRRERGGQNGHGGLQEAVSDRQPNR